MINVSTVNKLSDNLTFDSFSVERDLSLGGYKIKLVWPNVPNAIFFKIYKAVLPRINFNQQYTLDQVGLEEITGTKRLLKITNTDILYNKNNFVTSENVVLKNTSSRFEEVPVDSYKFFELKQIKFNKKQKEYIFYDKNVKFGKSYSYLVTFINSSLKESKKILPLNINVEDFQYPQIAESVRSFDSVSGAAILIKNTTDKSIVGYKIFRRNSEINEKFYEYQTVKSKNGIVNFIDKQVIPGTLYEYKIYSINYFGTLSLSSYTIKYGNNHFFTNNATVAFPDVLIKKDNIGVEIHVQKNDERLIGFSVKRKDIWRQEQGFTYKQYTNSIWPQMILFTDNQGYFKDNNLQSNRTYQYKITTILKSQQEGGILFSPIIKLNDKEDIIEDTESNISDVSNFQFNKINIQVVNEKQLPIYVKFSPLYSGNFSHLICEFNNKQIIIDSVHSSFFIILLEKGKVDFKLKFYQNEQLLKSVENITVNIL